MRVPTHVKGAAALALCLAGCGAREPEPATAAASPAAAGSPGAQPASAAATAATTTSPAPAARRAVLRFDTDGDDFPSPLVDVMVSGQPTTMIVDTGATHQVVAAWVAEQIGPTTTSNDVGLDHAGKKLALARLPGAKIVVSAWGDIDATSSVVVPLPAALQERGIGGVLSPQALATEGRAVVLDFGKGAMSEAPLDDALRALEEQPGAALAGEVRSCGPGAGALAFVRANVAGVEVEAQVDTGATHTTVRAGSEAGTRLRPRAKGASAALAASGTFTVPTVHDAQVKVGAHEVATSVALVPKDARTVCPNDALLGMDVLRRCVLVLGTKAFAAKCVAP